MKLEACKDPKVRCSVCTEKHNCNVVNFDEVYDVYEHDLVSMEPGHSMSFIEAAPPIEFEPEFITVDAVFGCGHAAKITCTIDSAGPDVSMALNELCPSCETELTDQEIDRYDDDQMDPCFHCHNLGMGDYSINGDTSCAGCEHYGDSLLKTRYYDRVCSVCGSITADESHCHEMTGSFIKLCMMKGLTGRYPEETQWPCDEIECDACKFYQPPYVSIRPSRAEVMENNMCLAGEGCTAFEYRYPNDPDGCCCDDKDCPVINPDTIIDTEMYSPFSFDDIPF